MCIVGEKSIAKPALCYTFCEIKIVNLSFSLIPCSFQKTYYLLQVNKNTTCDFQNSGKICK